MNIPLIDESIFINFDVFNILFFCILPFSITSIVFAIMYITTKNNKSTTDTQPRMLTNIYSACLFFMLWTSIFIVYIFTNFDNTYLRNNLLPIYIAFSILCAFMKRICKFMSSEISFRRKQIKLSQKSNCLSWISLCHFMEWYFTVLYHMVSKYWISHNAQRQIGKILIILLLNFFQEIFAMNVVASEIFYKFCVFPVKKKLSKHCLKLEHDIKPNIEEWRGKMTMNLMIRLFASIATSLYYLVLFVCLGKEFVNNTMFDDANAYDICILMTSIFLAEDLVHNAITIIIFEFYFKFNLLGQFTNYIKSFGAYEKIMMCFILNISFIALQMFYY